MQDQIEDSEVVGKGAVETTGAFDEEQRCQRTPCSSTGGKQRFVDRGVFEFGGEVGGERCKEALGADEFFGRVEW